jgi:hypothetical protein
MEVVGYTLGPLNPQYRWIGGWVGPRSDLDTVKKRKICHCLKSNTDSLVVQFTV